MSDQLFSICSALAAIIKADAGLAAYCTTHFGASPRVFVGFDPANPPPATEMPWVALIPAGSQIDDSLDTREYQIDIGFAGINATIDTTTAGITKFVGYEKAYEAADKIQTLIYAALQPSQNNPTITTTIKDLGRPSVDLAHPRYLASWQVRVGSAI